MTEHHNADYMARARLVYSRLPVVIEEREWQLYGSFAAAQFTNSQREEAKEYIDQLKTIKTFGEFLEMFPAQGEV